MLLINLLVFSINRFWDCNPKAIYR